VRRLAVRLAAARASKPTSADKTKKGPNPPHDGIHLVTDVLKGRWVRRRELGLRTGEQRHQAYHPRAGKLIIDNSAHSSRSAAIICFASATTLQDRTPASTSIRNVVSSAFRTALSALCLLHPLQYIVLYPHDCHYSHHNSIFVPLASKSTCSWTRLTVLSNLSTGSVYICPCQPGA